MIHFFFFMIILTLERRKLVLKRENLEGVLGEEGFESGGGDAAATVRHRRLGLETGWDCSLGVEVLLFDERRRRLVQLLGLGLGCFSAVSPTRRVDVQKALRHPVPIWKKSDCHTRQKDGKGWGEVSIPFYPTLFLSLSFCFLLLLTFESTK